MVLHRVAKRFFANGPVSVCAIVAVCGSVVWAMEPAKLPLTTGKPGTAEKPAAAEKPRAAHSAIMLPRKPPRPIRPRIAQPRPAAQLPAGGSVLILAERKIVQRLRVAKKLIASKDYPRAVVLLQAVVEQAKDAFYYPDPTKRDSLQSVRRTAERMIGGMPQAGKDAYVLKYGTPAKLELAAAVKSGDMPQIAAIARNFFHTPAGYSAKYQMGVYHFDRGQQLAAALCFEQLRSTPEAARDLEPQLSLRAAICWAQTGLTTKMKDALATVVRVQGNRPLTVAGRPVTLFGNLEDGPEWLATNFGAATGGRAVRESDWTVFRGGLARNGVAKWPEQPANIAWNKSLVPDPTSDPFGDRSDQADTAIRTQLSDAISSARRQYQQQRWMVFPQTQPIAVGNVLVTRTISSLRAIDVNSGKTLWESWPDGMLERLLTDDGKGKLPSSTAYIRQLAAQRVFGDMTWGVSSSDGELVFSIEDVGLQSAVRVPTANPRVYKSLLSDRRVNRLVARRLKTNGIAWSIGGSLIDDLGSDPLAGTYFLGSPLPIAGQLYAIAEVSGEVRLMVFDLNDDTRRPELAWSQPLIGPSLRIDNDRTRRVTGTGVSYSDGVVVCPTDAGYVIAIDVTTRSLLWGYRYQSASPRPRPFPRPRPRPQPGRAARWLDSSCTISNGHVLITPPGTDDLVCLNLLDGGVVWKKKRDDGLYVVGIHGGKAIIVGSGSVRALNIKDGSAAWKTATTIPVPSGRGVATESRLLVPLSTGEIATIEIKTGRLLAKTKTPAGRVPGNLLLTNGVLISQGTDSVEAMPLPAVPVK